MIKKTKQKTVKDFIIHDKHRVSRYRRKFNREFR